MRKEIFDIVIDNQKELISNLKNTLRTYESSTDLDEESTIDLDDQSHQADIQNLKLEINQKLQMEMDDLKTVQALRLREASEVQEGAIIETKENIFMVGFTFSPITYQDKKILGLSVQAPAYEANQGKRKGDDLKLGNSSTTIVNIY